jgi:hypothetical protein
MTRPALIVTTLAVLSWLATIVALVFALTQPVEASPQVEPLTQPVADGARSIKARAGYYAQFEQRCHSQWTALPRSMERGGMTWDYAETTLGWLNDGTCICIHRQTASAGTILLELHQVNRLAISPDAKIGFHAVELRIDGALLPPDHPRSIAATRYNFETLYRQIPGLWEWFEQNAMTSREIVWLPGSWFNDRGVPTCEVR